MGNASGISGPASASWIRCYRPNPQAHLRLICFPYAGGSAAVFRPWCDGLPSDIKVCAIQLPGRADRLEEGLFLDFKRLVQALAPAIQDLLDIPTTFWGHSLGAILGFEVAHQLYKDTGLLPVHLFLAGRSAPHITRSNRLIHLLPDGQFLTALRQLNGIPEEVLHNPELRQHFLPILRADICLNATYMYLPKPPLACPISVFGGTQDMSVSRSALDAWRQHTQAGFKLRMLPGDHFFLHSSRMHLLRAIAEDLKEYYPWQRTS